MKKPTMVSEIKAVLQESGKPLTLTEMKDELTKRGLNWDRISEEPLTEKQIAMRVSSKKNLSEFSITLGLNE
ncbi:hypothetical protein ACMSE3_25895 [Bacteroides thetaiotaomicron]|uniref:hypothetical protein n=1 Tax=Bacteroides thetaiotaomicron TaxID=818 RepID=UPI0039C20108